MGTFQSEADQPLADILVFFPMYRDDKTREIEGLLLLALLVGLEKYKIKKRSLSK